MCRTYRTDRPRCFRPSMSIDLSAHRPTGKGPSAESAELDAAFGLKSVFWPPFVPALPVGLGKSKEQVRGEESFWRMESDMQVPFRNPPYRRPLVGNWESSSQRLRALHDACLARIQARMASRAAAQIGGEGLLDFFGQFFLAARQVEDIDGGFRLRCR